MERENASGKEERAWSSSDLDASSEEAIAAACATLRKNFAFSCSLTSRDAKVGEPVKASATVVTKESKPPKEKAAKAPLAPPAAPLPAPKAISAASKPSPSPNPIHWDNDLWTNQSRFGGGSRCWGDGGMSVRPPGRHTTRPTEAGVRIQHTTKWRRFDGLAL